MYFSFLNYHFYIADAVGAENKYEGNGIPLSNMFYSGFELYICQKYYYMSHYAFFTKLRLLNEESTV